MKRALWRSVALNLYKSAKNVYLLLAVILLFFSLLQPVLSELLQKQFDNALEVFDRTSSIGAMREIECVAYALIASQAYLIERKSGYMRFELQREGRRLYLFSCLVATAVYAVFTVLSGVGLFILFLRWHGYPLYPTTSEKLSELSVSGSQILASNHPWRIWLIIGGCLMISSTAWTISTLAVSACTDNLFVVVISPMLLSLFLHFIMSIIDHMNQNVLIDNGIDLYYLGRGITKISKPLDAIFLTLLWYLPIIYISSVIFWYAATRRMQHE